MANKKRGSIVNVSSIYGIVSPAPKIYENKKGDLGKVISSNKKIKKILNWRPKYNSLKDILKSSYLWQKKLKNEK